MRFTLFETAIGSCAVVWNERGIVGVQLPERGADATRARALRRFRGANEGEPPAHAAAAIAAIRAHLRGQPAGLDAIALDMTDVEEFERRVYEITRAIPSGTTVTYGDVAVRLGIARDARPVGQALGSNPFPIVIPCHRVIAADGRMHGFSGAGGVTTKLRLLEIEGYQTAPGPSLFDADVTPQ